MKKMVIKKYLVIYNYVLKVVHIFLFTRLTFIEVQQLVQDNFPSNLDIYVILYVPEF